MSGTEYEELMDTIRRAAARIFEYAETEEEVCRLEQAINHDIMYVAAIAQSERVKPPTGWDPLGRYGYAKSYRSFVAVRKSS